MNTSCFDVTIEDHVAQIVLKRADALNTMTREFWNELPDIVRDINDGAKARVIVVSSTGKHFTAGMDASIFTQGALSGAGADRYALAEEFRHHVFRLQETFSCFERARMPVIAAVQGGCVGGGVDMVSACDIRYCTEDAFFQIAEINLAITADVGTFPRLCRLIPDGAVRELAYTGRRLSATQALALGLVNQVFANQAAMMQHVLAVAGEIAEKSPVAVAGAKRMINYARDHTTADALDYVATWQTGMFAPEHVREAFTAKAEKRPPEYPDLLPLRGKM